ncbi:MAG: hypothetical protein JXQ75_24055 [Phycisphaerae bacterium]|nr:hypothetical protein [Phycisphaerae bacterium]
MTHLLAIIVAAAPTVGWSVAPDGGSDRTLDAFGARQAVLEQAFADFDQAVAMKDHAGPERQRLYRRALAGFESLLQGGLENGGLYYNVANTYLRLGNVGKAIVNYRRALRLMPGDERIRKNLQSARNLCRVRIPAPATSTFVKTLFFWHFGTSLTARTNVALVGYVLFWGLLLVRQIALRGLPGFAWTIRAVAAVTLILGASVAWDIATQQHLMEGVVIADEVVLRKGNGEYYEPQLEQTLSEGVEFRLIETRNDVEETLWYQVELRDGKRGWLRADQADVI